MIDFLEPDLCDGAQVCFMKYYDEKFINFNQKIYFEYLMIN